MMKTTSGRDKVCALFQYSVQLYVQSIRNSFEHLDDANLKKVKVCTRIVKSISNSRKMLRFMRFIEGIRRLLKQIQDILRQLDINKMIDKQQINVKINADTFFKFIKVIVRLAVQISSILFYFFDDITLLT